MWGQFRIIAFITGQKVIQKILRHLKNPTPALLQNTSFHIPATFTCISPTRNARPVPSHPNTFTGSCLQPPCLAPYTSAIVTETERGVTAPPKLGKLQPAGLGWVMIFPDP